MMTGPTAATAPTMASCAPGRIQGTDPVGEQEQPGEVIVDHRLGLSTPDDAAVIGVDDIPAAKLAVPPLTTVTTDQAAIARHLAQTVVSIITGEPEPPPAGIRRGPGDPARLRVGREPPGTSTTFYA